MVNNDEKKWIVLCFLLCTLSLILFYFVSLTKVTSIPLNANFGLLSSISPLWFLSFALIIASVLIAIFKTKKEYCFLFTLFIFILIFFGAGIFAESMPRDHDAYWHTGASLGIIEQNHLDFSDYETDYHTNFIIEYININPGSFIFFSELLLLTGLSNSSLIFIKYFPLILIGLIVLSNYILFRSIFPKPQIYRLLIFIFLLFNVYLQYHVSPFALGLSIFVFSFLYILNKNIKFQIFNLIFLLVLSLVSLPLFIISICLRFFIFLLNFKDSKEKNYFYLFLLIIFLFTCFNNSQILANMAPLLNVIYLILSISGLIILITILINFKKIYNFINSIKYKNIIFIPLILSLIYIFYLGNLEPTFNISRYIRLLLLVLFVTFYMFLLLNEKYKIDKTLLISISFFLISGLIFIFQYWLFPSFNLIDRGFLIFIYSFVLILGILIKNKIKFFSYILTIIIILAIIFSITFYNQEGLYLIGEENQATWDYVYDQSDKNDKILGGKDSFVKYLDINQIRKIEFNFKIEEEKVYFLSNYDIIVINPQFIILTNSLNSKKITNFEFMEDSFNLVYDSKKTNIFSKI